MSPLGLWMNTAFDIFIADSLDSVRKVTKSTGLISKYAGGATSSAAGNGHGQDATATGLTVRATGLCGDTVGNLFIADTNANMVSRRVCVMFVLF